MIGFKQEEEGEEKTKVAEHVVEKGQVETTNMTTNTNMMTPDDCSHTNNAKSCSAQV